MNQLHLQNDEPNQNAYAATQTNVTDTVANGQAVAPQTISQTSATQAALKPEYLTLLLGELETLLNKRFLLRTAAHSLAVTTVVALTAGITNAYKFMWSTSQQWNSAIDRWRNHQYGAQYEAWHNSVQPPHYMSFPREVLDRLSPAHFSLDGSWNFGTLFCYTLIGSAVCYYLALNKRREQEKRIRAIAEMDDPRVIGALLETAQSNRGAARQTARNALLKQLLSLKASDGVALNGAQKQALVRAMNFKDTELTLAILKALEQIGDTSAIPAVQKIAAGRGDVSRDWQIMEAANECLPFLTQDAEKRQASAQLLRPVPNVVNPTDAQQLLRPTQNEES